MARPTGVERPWHRYVSETALDRARARARSATIEDTVLFERHDLSTWTPRDFHVHQRAIPSDAAHLPTARDHPQSRANGHTRWTHPRRQTTHQRHRGYGTRILRKGLRHQRNPSPRSTSPLTNGFDITWVERSAWQRGPADSKPLFATTSSPSSAGLMDPSMSVKLSWVWRRWC